MAMLCYLSTGNLVNIAAHVKTTKISLLKPLFINISKCKLPAGGQVTPLSQGQIFKSLSHSFLRIFYQLTQSL